MSALSASEREALRDSLGWEWAAEPGIPSVDDALAETYAAVESILAARAADPGDAGLRAQIEALAQKRPDGDGVVRVTIRPIPGVGIGERTTTYVSQHLLSAALDAPAGTPTGGENGAES